MELYGIQFLYMESESKNYINFYQMSVGNKIQMNICFISNKITVRVIEYLIGLRSSRTFVTASSSYRKGLLKSKSYSSSFS